MVYMEQYSSIQVLKCLLIFSRALGLCPKKGSGIKGVVLYRVWLRGFLFQTGACLGFKSLVVTVYNDLS